MTLTVYNCLGLGLETWFTKRNYAKFAVLFYKFANSKNIYYICNLNNK